MSTFRRNSNGTIYLYHYYGTPTPIKISTRIKIELTDWNKEKQRAKSSNQKFQGKTINSELLRHEKAFYDALNYFDHNKGFSPKNLNEKYHELLTKGYIPKGRIVKSDFIEYFQTRYDEFKEEGKSNYKAYGTTLTHVRGFFGKNKPSFEEIDMDFYLRFNKYLIKSDLSKNSISGHWKNIKFLMKESFYLKMHKNSDFNMFKRYKEESDSIFLTEKEIESIYKLDLKGPIDIARDYLVIACVTGLRFEDWNLVDKSRIKDKLITVKTTKTGKTVIIPVHPYVTAILNKYSNGKLPKKVSNQKMNGYIKKVGFMAKINETVDVRITKGGKPIKTSPPKYKLIKTHTCRRSFCSNLILRRTEIHLIMQMTGHTSIVSFQKYVKITKLQTTQALGNIDFFK